MLADAHKNTVLADHLSSLLVEASQHAFGVAGGQWESGVGKPAVVKNAWWSEQPHTHTKCGDVNPL